MSLFTNQASLSYNGKVVNSNVATGDLVEVLSATKTAVMNDYVADADVSYIISLVNAGDADYSNLTITDNLGAYTFGTATLCPLTYYAGSIRYYIDGALQAPPTIVVGPTLEINGINVPANGNAMVVFETQANQCAPLDVGSTIVADAEVSGGGLPTPLVASSTIQVNTVANLTISKSISPAVVTQNGEVTYSFMIQNYGNTAAIDTDQVAILDTFDPILDPIVVKFNDVVWDPVTNYTYNSTTGVFETVPGEITVPAATFTQDATSGNWIINPSASILTVTGTI